MDSNESNEGYATAFDTTLDALSIGDLLLLRQRIDARLPATSLSELDLEQELVSQFLSVKELLHSTANDIMTPANQKAQLINACSSVLLQMTKTQTDLFGSERVKAMERSLLIALKSVSQKLAGEFLQAYEEEYHKGKA